ncbi:uncharacterized protein LOC136080096 [Hydra vulgaris]|uniref:Uncharacterized protein LOC136080096 n=1 Tax=Hydra vulgaris TaxID=6087 RepID=A0ABM4BUB7_HYDVU
MEYCCHIWDRSSKDALSPLDKVQKRNVNIVGPALTSNLQRLSHRRNVASLSLFYKCYNGHCSNVLASLIPSTKFHSYLFSFFPQTSVLWKLLPSSCFPDYYNLQSFKSSVNHYLAQ